MPICRAIAKYGKKFFSVEKIVCCDSWSRCCEEEKKYIKRLKTHISTGQGYNVTWGGEGTLGVVTPLTNEGVNRISASHSKPVTIDGVTYSSRIEAAKVLGVDRHTIYRWIKRSTLDAESRKEKKHPNAVKCSIEGIEYPSKSAAMKALGISERLLNKIISEEKPYAKQPIIIDGVRYKTLKEAAEIHGVLPDTIKNWLSGSNRGQGKGGTKIEVFGFIFLSKKEAQEKFGLSRRKLENLLSCGKATLI